MTVYETLHCIAKRLNPTTRKWEDINDPVFHIKGGIGIRKGDKIIQVVTESGDRKRAHWFDPITSQPQQKTKKGDGLWDPKEKIFRRIIGKETWRSESTRSSR